MQIIGIDLGNITTIIETKDASQVIESRLKNATDLELLSEATIIETSNGKQVVGVGEFENNLFKYDKRNFIDLLHYGVANNTNVNQVKLVTGIPAKQYNSYKSELQNKIMSNNKIEITIDSIPKKTYINEVMVLPEGYGVYKTTPKELLIPGARTLVIDLGGGTTDTARFDANSRFIDGDSIPIGLLDLYKLVQSELQDKFKTYKTIEDTKLYYDNKLTFIGINDSCKEGPTKEIFESLYNQLLGKYPDLKEYNIIICGGGAEVFGLSFKAILPQTIINNDITANAKAYYAIGATKWRE